MTNPNDAVGTNAAYGTRTSVNAFNDFCQLVNGRGVLSGWKVQPKAGMVVSVGGEAGIRDVAIAEDNLGNRTTINNRVSASIDVEVPAASVSSNRYDAIVVYANNPAQADDTTPDAPSVCGIIEVQGGTTGVSEQQIRSAISADGGTGSVAYYAVLATVFVAAGTTTITSGNIQQTYIDTKIEENSDLFYKSGDVFGETESSDMIINLTGYLTSLAQWLVITVPMPKSLKNISSASVTKMVGWGRVDGDYITGLNNGDAVAQAASVEARVDKEFNAIVLLFKKTGSATWSSKNNQPISFAARDIEIRLS